MMIRIRTRRYIARTSTILASALLLTACGGGEGGVFGTDSALPCIDTQDVEGGDVDVTNTCESNIVVLTDEGERLVIPPGGTNRLRNTDGFFSIAACFSPNEPDFDGNEFTCG